MTNPSSITSVSIGDLKFNALSSQFGISTHHDEMGMPTMGSLSMSVDLTMDIHDYEAVPFSVINALFDLANGVTRDKIKPIKSPTGVTNSGRMPSSPTALTVGSAASRQAAVPVPITRCTFNSNPSWMQSNS